MVCSYLFQIDFRACASTDQINTTSCSRPIAQSCPSMLELFPALATTLHLSGPIGTVMHGKIPYLMQQCSAVEVETENVLNEIILFLCFCAFQNSFTTPPNKSNQFGVARCPSLHPSLVKYPRIPLSSNLPSARLCEIKPSDTRPSLPSVAPPLLRAVFLFVTYRWSLATLPPPLFAGSFRVRSTPSGCAASPRIDRITRWCRWVVDENSHVEDYYTSTVVRRKGTQSRCGGIGGTYL